MNFLKSPSDIKVWCRHRNGRTIWYAYNPRTEKQRSFSDQSQLRTWLDNHDPGVPPHRFATYWGGGPNAHPLHYSR